VLASRPAIWPLIENLRISLPLSINQEASLRRLITALFQKLSNLSSLAIVTTVAASGPSEIWTQCGTLFRDCVFRLCSLQCSFSLDADFASFLETQSVLFELNWTVFGLRSTQDAKPTRLLSQRALPRLSVLPFKACLQRRLHTFGISYATIR
jgi:hypothetical protein